MTEGISSVRAGQSKQNMNMNKGKIKRNIISENDKCIILVKNVDSIKGEVVTNRIRVLKRNNINN